MSKASEIFNREFAALEVAKQHEKSGKGITIGRTVQRGLNGYWVAAQIFVPDSEVDQEIAKGTP